MQQPLIKTYKPTTTKGPYEFYALNKGKNSGRPSYTPNVNSFVVICNSQHELEQCYTTCFVLWKGRRFHPIMCGSVIDFIRLKEFRSILVQALNQLSTQEDRLSKISCMLKQLEETEQRITKQLTLIKRLKVSLVAELFTKDGKYAL